MHETNIQFIIVQMVAFVDEVVRNKQNQFINLLKHKYNTNLCVCHNRFFLHLYHLTYFGYLFVFNLKYIWRVLEKINVVKPNHVYFYDTFIVSVRFA